MAISINPLTYVIYIPQSDLTPVSGTLYSLDTNAFRLELKDWEDSEEGIVQPKTHNHNTEVTIVGTTYARAINILPPYSIEFEDGQYTVLLTGSNNNIFDVANGVLVQNQVQVIPNNSAGLITVTSGSGVTPQDKTDIINGVWNNLTEGSLKAEDILRILLSFAAGEATGGGTTAIKFRDQADTKDRITMTVDENGNRSVTNVDGS
jgi:hypothetical protein